MKAAHPEVVATNRVNPGETLRQARESRSWSLPDVALRLNLTVTSLTNLENGQFEKLPGHTFARGYVRAYAKLLDLDQAALVEQFDQFTGTDGKGSSVHALGRIEEPVRLSHNILRIVSLLLLVILVGGGFFWWQDQATLRGKDQSGLNMEHVEVESADGTTQIHPLDEPEEPAVAETPASGQTSLPLNTGALASEAPAAAPAAPASSVTGHATAQPQTPAAATPPASAPQAPVAAPNVPSMPTAPAEQPAPVVAGAGQVTVQFVADCWTQVTDGNGKVLVSGLKRKGESLDVNGKPPLTLRLGYARGAQVSYNGQPVDVAPFTSGETARLKLGQ
ncbi:RodZ domain-containing protein [Pseudomonas syringae]|uniref:RodZ domain-containing protein n=1 Tax=Pseudomonas syringae TaxID=317 RepID=UPI0004189EE8|nr:RodZ family helix-turn-helix domain-containing protein [Pseudomonas syringae]KWS20793.1 Cro/Cl family transcriptional regulator [Pseudomonas syringae pv. syringae]MDF5776945.1 helix-turn-helix domain-containing protein [Pseudomonas syringae pv. syringae]MDY2565134.1 RodZ family helix-turn-helix domain-containing protein [Pseudomonas syringae]PBP51296.1 Cro/Cl family transcriptional regulator [Pseudomonas syringae]RXT62062.1 Cro/Cl family transcriptional regulator [Pseudomonas syringae]